MSALQHEHGNARGCLTRPHTHTHTHTHKHTHTHTHTHTQTDFEPDTSEVAWVHAYADYVTAFTAAMHKYGLRAEMCVSSWGILDGHELPNGEGCEDPPLFVNSVVLVNISPECTPAHHKSVHGMTFHRCSSRIRDVFERSVAFLSVRTLPNPRRGLSYKVRILSFSE